MSSTQQLLLGEGAGGGAAPAYIEDVFSCFLYAGTNASQTITNNIDLSGKGGLVWQKQRTSAIGHRLFDTVQTLGNELASNSASAVTNAGNLTAFSSTGFTVASSISDVGETYATWTFRKQPKFFDIVTYTGTGSARTVAHNLGSVPGCMMVKQTNGNNLWTVYHRGVDATNPQNYGLWFQTNARDLDTYWNNTAPTSTVFTVGPKDGTNASGQTYIAYLFAHDAGGFGLTGLDNVISCGSFTSSGNYPQITLGYEPQWVLIKRTDSATDGDWMLADFMRPGFNANAALGNEATYILKPNTSGAETTGVIYAGPNATGFSGYFGAGSRSFIYIAIRRGPMKVPTTGTSVFEIVARSGNNTNTTVGTSLTADATIIKCRSTVSGSPFPLWADRLRGNLYIRMDNSIAPEATSTNLLQTNPWDVQAGVKVGTGGSSSNATNASGQTYINYLFKRAPKFMDVVCYTGVNSGGQTLTVTHNLAVTPELVAIRNRAGSDFFVYTAPTGTSNTLYINLDNAATAYTLVSSPTASTFTVNGVANVDTNTYLAFLFATLAGVSKVGSYTGTGALQTINCGFTSGARFVMIKRTSSTGEWYFWDSTRGITSGNDPYLLMNQAGTEVTGTNYVDTDATGFKVTAAAPAEINGSGGTFIFLAIA